MNRGIAEVFDIKVKPRVKCKPLPLSTITFQKLSAQKLRLTSHQAMNIAEKLYQNGFISYPRTETDRYNPGTDFQALLQVQADNREWGGFATHLLNSPDAFSLPRQGSHDDKAHPPIHPTKLPTSPLSPQEAKVFELVCRSFLATCSKDAKADETIIDCDISGEVFTAKGLVISEKNYLEVYKYETWGSPANSLPEGVAFSIGETFVPSLLRLREGDTSAPNPLTEEELIGVMYRNGIGTDATIPSHIEKIQKRKYAEKRERYFYPTDLGKALVEGYDAMGVNLSKPALRADMERGMVAVSEGRLEKAEFLRQTLHTMENVFQTVASRQQMLKTAVDRIFNRNLGNVGSGGVPMCRCGVPCSRKTVVRPGSDDHGREFYACAKPINAQRCSTMIWIRN